MWQMETYPTIVKQTKEDWCIQVLENLYATIVDGHHTKGNIVLLKNKTENKDSLEKIIQTRIQT